MHSKLFVVKFDFETIDNEELMDEVDSYIYHYPYDSGEIDYIQSMEDMASRESILNSNEDNHDGNYYRSELIKSKVDNFCEEFNAEKIGENKVKFTKDGLYQYFRKVIDRIKKHMDSIGYDVDKFLKERYHLIYGILDEDHPKYYCNYAGCEGESSFIDTICCKMRYDNINEIELEIIDVFDYHF